MSRIARRVYGLGAIPIASILGFSKEPEREIIDVEYEDLSDQIEEDIPPSKISNKEIQTK